VYLLKISQCRTPMLTRLRLRTGWLVVMRTAQALTHINTSCEIRTHGLCVPFCLESFVIVKLCYVKLILKRTHGAGHQSWNVSDFHFGSSGFEPRAENLLSCLKFLLIFLSTPQDNYLPVTRKVFLHLSAHLAVIYTAFHEMWLLLWKT
jgi:hypothetical protein